MDTQMESQIRRHDNMNKDKNLRIRMTQNDYKIIARKAELLDLTVSEYLRQAAIGKQVKGFKLADIQMPQEQCKGQMELSDLL